MLPFMTVLVGTSGFIVWKKTRQSSVVIPQITADEGEINEKEKVQMILLFCFKVLYI